MIYSTFSQHAAEAEDEAYSTSSPSLDCPSVLSKIIFVFQEKITRFSLPRPIKYIKLQSPYLYYWVHTKELSAVILFPPCIYVTLFYSTVVNLNVCSESLFVYSNQKNEHKKRSHTVNAKKGIRVGRGSRCVFLAVRAV